MSSWKIRSLLPGNPGATAVGSFTVGLFPPGSEEYATGKGVYDRVEPGMRVEAYLGLSAGAIPLTFMKFAGIIRQKDLKYGDVGNSVQLSGDDDLGQIKLSQPFPGEVPSAAATGGLIKNYMGTNELGASDSLATLTAGDISAAGAASIPNGWAPGAGFGARYNSAGVGAGTAGNWAPGTDDSFPVVQVSSGSGAGLFSMVGAAAQDALWRQYVEVTGRLATTSLSAVNAGSMGVGIGPNVLGAENALVGRIVLKWNATTLRYDLDALIDQYVNGVVTTKTQSNALTSVDAPDGTIALSIGLHWHADLGGFTNQAHLTVNGQTVISGYQVTNSPGNLTQYPFLYYATPASGAATASMSNLNQFIRVAADGPMASMIAIGQGFAQTNKLPAGSVGASFLDVWATCAAREAAYIRYTPKPYVVGSRALGTLDFASDPGADLTARCIFAAGENLTGLGLNTNMDSAVPSTQLLAPPGSAGGVVAWRDPAGMRRFGVFGDQTLGSIRGFAAARRAAALLVAQKLSIDLAGSKTAVVLRDSNADVWRELDRVTVDAPLLGVFKLTARIVGYDFAEGSDRQTMLLDQFAASDLVVLAKRQQQALFRLAGGG